MPRGFGEGRHTDEDDAGALYDVGLRYSAYGLREESDGGLTVSLGGSGRVYLAGTETGVRMDATALGVVGVFGHDGADHLVAGGVEGKALVGGGGADRLSGGSAGDMLSGDGGADTLLGHGGDDVLHGGEGADRLEGGSGEDVLSGGGGADALTGNAGAIRGGGEAAGIFGAEGPGGAWRAYGLERRDQSSRPVQAPSDWAEAAVAFSP